MSTQLDCHHYSFLIIVCSTEVWPSTLPICYSRGKKSGDSALCKGPSEGKKAVRATGFSLLKLMDL